jgi:hypothetical protein
MGHYRSYCTNQERTYYLSEFIIELQFLISYFLIRYEDEPPVDDTEVFMHRYFRILLLLFTGAMIDYCCLSYFVGWSFLVLLFALVYICPPPYSYLLG